MNDQDRLSRILKVSRLNCCLSARRSESGFEVLKAVDSERSEIVSA